MYSSIMLLKHLLLICGFILTAVMAAETEAHTPEFFTSVSGLEYLLRTEKFLLTDARKYIEESKKALADLESEIKVIEEDYKLITASKKNNFLSSPVNAYRLIRRLYYDWSRYEENILQNKAQQDFLNNLNEHKNTQHFPRQIDVSGAAAALLRLQKTYKLPVSEIAAGVLNGVKYGNEMTWRDCITIFDYMVQFEEYKEIRLWLQQFIKRISGEDYTKDTEMLDTMERAAETLAFFGDVQSSLNLSKLVLSTDPRRKDTKLIETVLKYKKEPPVQTVPINPYHKTPEYEKYEKLCQGDIESSHSRLFRCFYATNNVPYRLILPFKVEVLSLDPLIVTFHDMLTDRTINAIKRLAMPNIHHSIPEPFDDNISWPFQYKINKCTWLPYESHKDMQKMLLDLHDATGLYTTIDDVSRQLHVVNYGLGGYYEPHLDLMWLNREIPPDNKLGDRIATAMFYLSNVEQGCATVFPNLNLTVQPKRGNLLLWFNMHPSFKPDFRTLHGSCPVIAGSKWIANIWIHEHPQMFVAPCVLQQNNNYQSTQT